MWLESPLRTLTVGLLALVAGAIIIAGGLSALSAVLPL